MNYSLLAAWIVFMLTACTAGTKTVKTIACSQGKYAVIIMKKKLFEKSDLFLSNSLVGYIKCDLWKPCPLVSVVPMKTPEH